MPWQLFLPQQRFFPKFFQQQIRLRHAQPLFERVPDDAVPGIADIEARTAGVVEEVLGFLRREAERSATSDFFILS